MIISILLLLISILSILVVLIIGIKIGRDMYDKDMREEDKMFFRDKQKEGK